MPKLITLFFILLIVSITWSQRTVNAERLNNFSVIGIDGVLNEPEWEKAETVTDFTQITPYAGGKATLNTTVKVLYDDFAIYFGAHCYGNPQEISRVLSQRDRFNSNTDYFSVMIDTYQDKLNGFVFSVSTEGVQYDAKIYGGEYNSKLDMIWYGEVNHSDSGFTVEIKIPYSAIRFAPKSEQNWGVNFTRYHSLNREESSWNIIEPDLNNIVTQAGILEGIKNITPPLRLFLSPYTSSYIEHYPAASEEMSDWTLSLNGGMDVKYGVNEAFTLDMTLIPDFGQVVTDNVILNLTPFEVFFVENRPFFNEGTELFEKTDHFYTRRVGGTPLFQRQVRNNLNAHEKVISNPSNSPLINASKFSGRNKNGLGVGVFNGISAPQYAIIEDTLNLTSREFETNPLSNYNVLVFDQNLKNNSSITLTNTNAWRSGHVYDANLTAIASQINTKNNNYFARINNTISQKYRQVENEFGHSIDFAAGKQKGNFTYNFSYLEQSDTYDPNDLGFLFVSNKRNIAKNIFYNIYKPFWKLNRLWSSLHLYYNRLYNPDVYTQSSVHLNGGITNKKFHSASIASSTNLTANYDYFEPRTPGFFFIRPQSYSTSGWISSNYQRAFAIDANIGFTNFTTPGWFDISYGISPRFRIGNKLFLIYRFDEVRNFNQIGYAIPFNSESNSQPEGYNPIFTERDVITTTNTIDLNYTMNNKNGINLRLRHYWSRIASKNFFELQETGRLNNLNDLQTENNAGEPIFNTSFNAFSIDLVYRWIFSPASEVNIVWKNNIFTDNSNAFAQYAENLTQTLQADQLNSFSIRIVYFVDYLDLKTYFKRKEVI
jgi:hypothetical protein